MTETNKFWNIMYILIGIAMIGIGVPTLFRHQYATYDRNTDWIWTPTIVWLFLGTWCLVFGSLGVIRERRKGKSK